MAMVAVVIVLGAACGDSDPAGPQGPPGAAPFVSEPAAPSAAVEAASTYLEDRYGTIDIASLSVISYVGENWKVPALAAAADAAEERLMAADLDPEEAAMARMADPLMVADAALGAGFAPDSTTTTLARVLRCDVDPLSDADLVALDALVDGGGYDATHAALAVVWLEELGCEVEDAGPRRVRLVEAIGAELAAGEEVTDLAVEQSAVLHYLDAGDHVPGDWSGHVLAAQRADGGWGERVSTWHMTMLAVWTILAETETDEGVPMVGRTT